MLSYTVTIGRNVGSEPMSDDDWIEFQTLVQQTLERVLEPSAVFVYTGMGEWDGEAEESTAYLVLSTIPAFSLLDERLGMLAEAFGQEAIGWSCGAAHLAAGVTPEVTR